MVHYNFSLESMLRRFFARLFLIWTLERLWSSMLTWILCRLRSPMLRVCRPVWWAIITGWQKFHLAVTWDTGLMNVSVPSYSRVKLLPPLHQDIRRDFLALASSFYSVFCFLQISSIRSGAGKMFGDGVARSFMRALVEIIGGYRFGLRQGVNFYQERRTFSPKYFCCWIFARRTEGFFLSKITHSHGEDTSPPMHVGPF